MIQNIKDLTVGAAVDSNFRVGDIQQRTTKTGKPFQSVIIQNITGQASMSVWDNMSYLLDGISIGDIIHVRGEKDAYGVKPTAVSKLDASEENMADYYDMGDPEMIGLEYDEIRMLVDRVKSPHLNALLRSFIDDPEIAENLKAHSAAKTIHQAYVGGLVNHLWHVAAICDYIATLYADLNRDLMIAGALLHDIGKLRELSEFPKNDYTDEGTLLGHIVIGMQMVDEHIRRIDGFPDDLRTELLHCIAAHHGTQAFGSPTEPHLMEAIAINCADTIDARLATATETLLNAVGAEYLRMPGSGSQLRKTNYN